MNAAWAAKLDAEFIRRMHAWGIPLLRVTLGIVFIWFGALKIFGASPVANLLISAFPFFPYPLFLVFLGAWEAAIGAGLLANRALRTTLALLWLQMLGTLATPFIAPKIFFAHNNPLLLSIEGEFVVKNLVLIAASIVLGGYSIAKRKKAL